MLTTLTIYFVIAIYMYGKRLGWNTYHLRLYFMDYLEASMVGLFWPITIYYLCVDGQFKNFITSNVRWK